LSVENKIIGNLKNKQNENTTDLQKEVSNESLNSPMMRSKSKLIDSNESQERVVNTSNKRNADIVEADQIIEKLKTP
jgi:hypothetical protein